ncbi:UNVERIFIED_CONTAM: putative E3 ubiquitin-protein ligase [Sesamum radiatum]|uniref:E3 ubiquitin-protein ligase n=1 Tax=Sesamum radiatum TaxID=300843 RepID=A0AAW2QIF4_SESRA
MTSMVAKACSSTSSQMPALTVQERGSRNKRKFRADPPLADPNKTIPAPQNECTSFEISADKFEAVPSHGHTNACNVYCVNQDSSDALKLDLGLSCTVGASEVGSTRRTSTEQFGHDFQSAIKKIVASGYGEEVASKAILRSGLWYGCKDTVSNIVENALAFLRSGQEIGPSREHYFEDLEQMEKYILAELVCLLREVRPFFSTGDAMWCLLICDMNVSHACAMDTDPLGSCIGDATSNGNSSISAQPQLRTEPRSLESNISVPCRPNASVAYALKCPPEALDPGEECNNSTSNIKEKPFSAAGISHTNTEEKFVGSRKLSGIAKREYILRQKSIHFERHYRAHGSKSTSRAGKLSGFSGLVLDKNLKAVAESTGLNAKNSFKIGKAVSFDVPQNDVNYNISISSGLTSVPTSGMETNNGNSLPVVPVNSSPSLPVADTELSLSFPAKGIANPMPSAIAMRLPIVVLLIPQTISPSGSGFRRTGKMRWL